MDTKCMEPYLMGNHPKVIQIFCVDNCTIWLYGEEDDQILSFKPEENPFVPILGDIAEATPTEMLIDEDEEGDEENDVLLWCIIWDFLITKCC